MCRGGQTSHSKKKKPEIVAIDFFCGAGGVTRGLSGAGIDVIAGIDIDSEFSKTYTSNNRKSKFIQKDVAKTSARDIRKLISDKSPEFLLFAGCAPCQPFSPHYRNDKGGDARGSVLLHFARLIEEVKPDFVFSENVPGMLTKDEGKVFNGFERLLTRNGYEVDFGVINAKWYGIPQDRKRLVLLASRTGIGIQLPDRTHGPKLLPYETVRNAIGKFPRLEAGWRSNSFPNHECAKLSPLNMKRMKSTPRDGGSWRDWPSQLKLRCHRRDGAGHSDVYGRMRWDSPSPTLTCRCYSISNGRFGHPTQNRAISFREAAAIQTYPDDYVFYGKSRFVLGMQIGNAVPVKLARVIGETVVKAAYESRQTRAH